MYTVSKPSTLFLRIFSYIKCADGTHRVWISPLSLIKITEANALRGSRLISMLTDFTTENNMWLLMLASFDKTFVSVKKSWDMIT